MANIMQNANTLRKALNTGSGLSFGAWQMLPGTHLSRSIAMAGFDWICIDCEHGNIAGKSYPQTSPLPLPALSGDIYQARYADMSLDNEMHESVHAIASCNVSPIVRIPANESWMVKRALDAGAHGIIVPLLYSVEDAQKLIQAAKYPPLGKRGYGSPFSMGAFDVEGNLSGTDYLKNANDNLLTIVQIETKQALDCVSRLSLRKEEQRKKQTE